MTEHFRCFVTDEVAVHDVCGRGALKRDLEVSRRQVKYVDDGLSHPRLRPKHWSGFGRPDARFFDFVFTLSATVSRREIPGLAGQASLRALALFGSHQGRGLRVAEGAELWSYIASVGTPDAGLHATILCSA